MADEVKIEMSEEQAMAEIEKWAEENDVDLYVTTKDGERMLDSTIPRLIKAVQKGSLVLNDENDFEYTISEKSPVGYKGEKLTLKCPTGAAYMAMDSFKDQQIIHKTLAIASAITGMDVKWFAKIHNTDYKVINAVVGFFIAG